MFDHFYVELLKKHPIAVRAYEVYLVLCLAYVIRITIIMKKVNKLPSVQKAKFAASLPKTKKWNPLLTFIGLATLALPRLALVVFVAISYLISAQYSNYLEYYFTKSTSTRCLDM
jgi:hypothetical protein